METFFIFSPLPTKVKERTQPDHSKPEFKLNYSLKCLIKCVVDCCELKTTQHRVYGKLKKYFKMSLENIIVGCYEGGPTYSNSTFKMLQLISYDATVPSTLILY